MIQLTQKQAEQKQSDTNLREMRERLRAQAAKAIQQIKENDMLSLQQIREAQYLFDNIEQTNKFLKNKNQKKKRQKRRLRTQTQQPRKSSKSQQKQKKQTVSTSNNQSRIIGVIYDQNRKWNEVLENEKKGKFQPQQKRILTSSLTQYLLINNIQLDALIQNITQKQHDKNEKIPQNLKLWTNVCSVLPNRSLRSCYKFLIRKLTKGEQNKKWSQADLESLMSLHEKFGNKWAIIGQKLGKNPQSVRDKFRNLEVKDKNSNSDEWKIEQFLTFLTSIEKLSRKQFLKKGYKVLLENADFHNQKQKQTKKYYKYNCKYMLSHNYVQILSFINSDEFCKIDRNTLRWKQISDRLGNKSQLQCKNKYIQLMQILIRDYSGESELKVLNFIQDQIKEKGQFINQNQIEWRKWSSDQGFTKQEAQNKWIMLKKKIKQRSDKSFYQLFKEAKSINLRKITKNYLKQQKQITKYSQKQKKKPTQILNKEKKTNNEYKKTRTHYKGYENEQQGIEQMYPQAINLGEEVQENKNIAISNLNIQIDSESSVKQIINNEDIEQVHQIEKNDHDEAFQEGQSPLLKKNIKKQKNREKEDINIKKKWNKNSETISFNLSFMNKK